MPHDSLTLMREQLWLPQTSSLLAQGCGDAANYGTGNRLASPTGN